MEHHNESAIRSFNSDFVRFQRINQHWRHVFHDVRVRQASSNVTRTLHVMNENLINYFISYVLLTESPYRQRIDQLLSYMDQAGETPCIIVTSYRYYTHILLTDLIGRSIVPLRVTTNKMLEFRLYKERSLRR